MLPAQDNSVVVTIANEAADAAVVADALEAFGATHGVPREALVALQVSVDEIVSNVIKYAWKDGVYQIHVRITSQTDAVKVEVVDDGEAFNPFGAPEAPTSQKSSKPSAGGIGIHMVRQLMDQVEYARKGMRNHTVLLKRCRLLPPRR
ncbi:ATP-binding protein [Piscinibacter sp. XHJ-5]|uniref:ATP-binding protein n=1 Tax=Piscinibacter sp. XHJ-5 TaxID=3037797 RepID=UPI002453072D|nr:ATP-binding protein [Piscinibacter sp. XHJ-5]